MPRHFTNWLQGYLDWTQASESPDQFHLWTGVGTIAGALRSCVWIDEPGYKYTPNFYIFFVAPPGVVSKSTSIGMGMRLLEQLLPPNAITFGPSSLTWQYLLKALQDATITVKWVDASGADQQRSASPITIEASELGSFLKLSQEGLTEMLIELWDGKISKRGFTHGTLSSGAVTVQNPWLHVLGATTPSWLTQNFPEHMIGGGLTSRILFVYGDKKKQLVAYPSRMLKALGIDFLDLERKLVEDLAEIAKFRGPFTVTEEAYQWGTAWYEQLWTNAPAYLATTRYEGYRSRKQALLHKIAMVLSAATREDMVIDEHVMESAALHLDSTEAAMLKVFDTIGVVSESKHVKELVSIVRSYASTFPKGMPSKTIFGLVANTMSVKEFEIAMISAVERGVLARTQLTIAPITYGVVLGSVTI